MRHPYPSSKIPRDLQVAAMLTPLSCTYVDRYGKRRIKRKRDQEAWDELPHAMALEFSPKITEQCSPC
jgi:hypothetical protein